MRWILGWSVCGYEVGAGTSLAAMAKVAGRASRQTAGSGFRLLARILLAVTGAGCWLASVYLDVGGAQCMP